MCDDYGGWAKASFQQGITEIGCRAREAQVLRIACQPQQRGGQAGTAVSIAALYDVERDVLRHSKRIDARYQLQRRAKPVLVVDTRFTNGWSRIASLVSEGPAIAKALDYSLKRWIALTRYLDDGCVPIDNNWVENQICPWAIGRNNWLFAGSLRAQRAAAIMSLIRSAQLNGHEPHAYLKDVLTRPSRHIVTVKSPRCCHIAGNHPR